MDVLKKILVLAKKEPKTMQERTLKLAEEVGELSEAVLSFQKAPGNIYKNKSVEDVLEECVDIIICSGAVIESLGQTEQDIENMFLKKILKWQDKMQEKRPAAMRAPRGSGVN